VVEVKKEGGFFIGLMLEIELRFSIVKQSLSSFGYPFLKKMQYKLDLRGHFLLPFGDQRILRIQTFSIIAFLFMISQPEDQLVISATCILSSPSYCSLYPCRHYFLAYFYFCRTTWRTTRNECQYFSLFL